MNSSKPTASRPTGRQVFGLGPSLRFTRPKRKVSIFYTMRARLVAAFLLVALIPMAILTYVNIRATRTALQEAANRALSSSARQTATSIDDFLRSRLYSLDEKAQSITLIDYLKLDPSSRSDSLQEIKIRSELNLAFQEELLLTKYTQGYMVFDKDGTILVDTSEFLVQNRTPFAGLDKVQPTAFRTMMNTGWSYISPVFSDPDKGGSRLYLVSSVTDENQQTIGVLVSFYNFELLQDFIARSINLAGEQSYPVLIDDAGIILANGDQVQTRRRLILPLETEEVQKLIDVGRLPDIITNQLIIDTPQMAAGLGFGPGEPGSVSFSTPSLESGNIVHAASTASLATTAWQVVYLQPQSVFLQPVNEQLRNSLLLALGIAVVTALIAFLTSRRMTGPISNLTQMAERVTAGDLWAQAPIGVDEIGQLASAFNNMTTELRHTLEGLEVRVAERTSELAKASEQMKYRANQLQTVAEVARAIASEQELDKLLKSVAGLISERFGFYHVGIFLVDTANEYAVLRAANSEGGQRMLERDHKLGVGQVGIVGYVTGRGEPRIALDVGSDAVYFDNPDLPYTRSEMALPLKVGNRVTGALDVQSMEQSAFSQDDVDLLSTLADQVAIAIENVRLFTETRTALSEMQSMHRQYLEKEWQEETQQSQRAGYELHGGRLTVVSPQSVSGKWVDVPASNPVILENAASKSLVTPITIRGQVVGMLDLAESDAPWTKDDISLVQAVADQIGVALENARLLEETQRRAEREHTVTEITARLRASNDPQVILQTAAQELRRVLRANSAHVIIPSKAQPEAKSNGDNPNPETPEEPVISGEISLDSEPAAPLEPADSLPEQPSVPEAEPSAEPEAEPDTLQTSVAE